jgi:amidohydrolase
MEEALIEEICAGAVSQDELSTIRRTFHAHPEISRHEFETSAKIAGYLTKWGIPFQTGVAETGIVAHLDGNRPGKNIALRADIDALPIQEKNMDLPYASCNPGVMHACGHDAHTTILLGAAKTLRSLNGNFPGSFTFFFQPAEEDYGGAERMIQAGYLDKYHVEHAIGLHLYPDLPAGKIGIRYGEMYASNDYVNLRVYGVSSHGAQPNKGIDAIIAGAQIVCALQTLVSRRADPVDPVVLTFGCVRGGNVRNQIADYVEYQGVLRALNKQTRSFCIEKIQQIANSVGQALDVRVEAEVLPGYDPLITDAAVTDVVKSVASQQLGEENILVENAPQMLAEDFAYFTNACPSSFYHLGCSVPHAEHIANLHSCLFDIDESCLSVGVRMQVNLALTLAGE